MRWRRPSNASSMPRWARPSRSSRSASPRLAQQLDGRVLEHAGPHAVLDVVAVALLEHDAVDAARRQEVGQHEPGRPGPDDRHLGLGDGHAAPWSRRSAASSTAVGGGDRLQLVGDGEVPAGRGARLLDRGAGLQGRQRQLARDRVRAQDADVGDDHLRPRAAEAEALAVARPVAEAHRRHEVDALDERPRRLAQQHDDLAARRGDLRCPAGAGQADLRRRVVADHRRVDVGEAVDLGAAEEADVDAAGLQPVVEDLRHADHAVGRVGELAVADRQRQATPAWSRACRTRRRAPGSGRGSAGRGWPPCSAGRCRRSTPRRRAGTAPRRRPSCHRRRRPAELAPPLRSSARRAPRWYVRHVPGDDARPTSDWKRSRSAEMASHAR